MSKTYPGVIKAFHYHEYKDDLRFFQVENAQLVPPPILLLITPKGVMMARA